MIDSMHTVLAAYGVFEDLVNLERDPLPVFFNRPQRHRSQMFLPSQDLEMMLAALIAVPVTVSLGEYSFRLCKDSGANNSMKCSIWALSVTLSQRPSILVDSFTYLDTSIQLYCLKETFEILTQKTGIYGVLVSSCASDWIITVATSVLLWREHSSFKRTNSLINTMIMYIVTTGLFPSIFVLVTVAVYAAIPGFFFVGMYIVLSKLYLNSFLATLNSRQSLNDQRQNDPMFFPPLSTNARRCGEASQHNGLKSTIRGQDLMVQVDTEMDRVVDPVPMRPQEWRTIVKVI
ncbi:hypothetical protein HETIRDRAFT_318209 [Heterobasidion irregulare TC 32-1]|uniref:DUF6534 domain-containing protein n=1 Tax=Heterobasidion irregulare (strain TC 32-1) TaxID=747525 RepID=W4K991_HETIT|nr:uncharacterized protein HETIRDRAFT_318209 [Heterobasidion irregulare TC 32-1]ETW81651.1 hypothetical protein HETIRDRAFT_318209 [Heterobasidion irregulare TC 32-1]